jgi:hypothetical protein
VPLHQESSSFEAPGSESLGCESSGLVRQRRTRAAAMVGIVTSVALLAIIVYVLVVIFSGLYQA